MANNIKIGPNGRVAFVTVDFPSMGLNEENCEIVYEVEGNYKSWKPGRVINAINVATNGRGYIIEAKQEMDLSLFLSPPFPFPESDLIDNFTFTLDEDRTTSGGVYKKNTGEQVKTLWSAMPLVAGTYREKWDGTNDFGEDISNDGPFEARILDSKVTYDWRGGWGNTSDQLTGDTIHNTLNSIVNVRVVPVGTKDMLCYASRYGEGEPAEGAAYTDDVQRKIIPSISHDKYGQSLNIDFLAANSTKLFRAVKDVFDDNSKTFIYATDKMTNALSVFSSGVSVQTVLGATYPSAIGLNQQSGFDSADVSGFTANDSYIYISRKLIDGISILNAVTGAFIGNVTVNKPAAVCIMGSDLWYAINGTSIVKRPINSDGTLGVVSLTINGFSNVLDINFFGLNITVVDGGNSQQIKTYNSSTGSSVWVRGQLGGYTGSGNKEVFNDKWMFNCIAALYQPIIERSSIAFARNGDYYLSDPGNMRVLHFDANGVFIDHISHEMRGYHVKVNKNNDKFILATHRVIEINPALPEKQGWKLKYNFQDASNANPVDDFTTLSNGRMYGTRRVIINDQTIVKVVELNPATGIRETKATIQDGPYELHEDGSVRWINDISNGAPRGGQQWWMKPLSGFDSDNDPIWGATVKVEEISLELSDPKAYSPISKKNSNKTNNGNLWSYDSHISAFDAPGQHRLGGHRNNKFMVKTMLTVEANHKGDFPEDGSMDWENYNRDENNNAKGYYGSAVMIHEDQVVCGVFGEFLRNGQCNKYIHIHEDGLLIGVFGDQRPQFDRRGNIPFRAGNAHTPNLHYYPEDGTLNLIHGTENGSQILHRIVINDFDSVRIQVGVPTTLPARVLPGLDLMEDFKRGDVVTGNKGRWSIPNPFITSNENKFDVRVGAMSVDRYRLAGVDLRFDFAMPSGSTKVVSCDLGNNLNLNSWNIKGLVEFLDNERNDPEGTSGYAIEVLDNAGLVIAEYFHRREPEFFKTSFRGNGQVIRVVDEDNADRDLKYQAILDMDNLKHFRNLEIGSSGSGIVFKYADFPSLTAPLKNSSANWRNPKTFRIRFFTQGTTYLRTVGIYKLRLFTT